MILTLGLGGGEGAKLDQTSSHPIAGGLKDRSQVIFEISDLLSEAIIARLLVFFKDDYVEGLLGGLLSIEKFKLGILRALCRDEVS